MPDPKSRQNPVVRPPRKAVRLDPVETRREPRVTHERRTIVIHHFDWHKIIGVIVFLILALAAGR